MNTRADTQILLVEDDEDISSVMLDLLSVENLRAEVVTNGKDALTYLERGHIPPLLLIDLSLPEMSGAELIQALNSHPARARMKLIITSGWNDLDGKTKEYGADGFLKKPFDLDGLVTFIRSALS